MYVQCIWPKHGQRTVTSIFNWRVATKRPSAVVGMGSERLSTDMGLIIMATPHKVLRYMGFGQKSLWAVLERKEKFFGDLPISEI